MHIRRCHAAIAFPCHPTLVLVAFTSIFGQCYGFSPSASALLQRPGAVQCSHLDEGSWTVSPEKYARCPRIDASSMQATSPAKAIASASTGISAFLDRFGITLQSWGGFLASAASDIEASDVAWLMLIGWLALPASRFVRNQWVSLKQSLDRDENTPDETGGEFEGSKKYEHTLYYQIVNLLAQASRIGIFVLASGSAFGALRKAGFHFFNKVHFSLGTLAKISYSVWIAFRLRTFKRYLLRRALDKGASISEELENPLGKISLYDKFLDTIIVFLCAALILDLLDVNIGLLARSAFTLGGVGTLVLSLASKDLASHLVSGIAIGASERFYEGDEIRLRDGIEGEVTKQGLIETEIRGGDEIKTRIPNSRIANQFISNLSRSTRSQVKQTLKFRYEDIDKIPKLVEDIENEIKRSCARLITDGTRPFRVVWTDYGDDHLEVLVDSHYYVKPIGDPYFNNRQKVLEAIARAVKQNGVKFAMPTVISVNKMDDEDSAAIPLFKQRLWEDE